MTPLDAPYKYSQGYITYQLPMLPGLPPKVKVNGRVYQAKAELHCSLIKVVKAADLVAARQQLALETAEQQVAAVCFKAIHDIKPEFDSYLNDVRLVDQPERDRHTIVVMARANGLKEFFANVNRQLGLELPVQIPHVSLFLEKGLPIGITSPEDLDKWTKPLTSAARDELTVQLDPKKTFGWEAYR